MITISQTAAQEVQRIQLSRQQPHTYLRLKVKQGGCSGLLYHLELNDHPLPKSLSGDRQFETKGITIIIDQESSIYIEDLQIDYSEDLMGGGFRFDNAKAIRNCNCGQSFSIKHT